MIEPERRALILHIERTGAQQVDQPRQHRAKRAALQPRAMRQRFLAHGRFARSSRQDLQGQPRARLLRDGSPLDLACLARRGLGICNIAGHVGLVGRPHQQGTDLLFRGRRRAREGVEQLTQVLQAAALLEQPHQPLERLPEVRVRVEGGQVVARGGGLVGGPLLEVRDLGQEPRLSPLVRGGR